MCNPRRVRIRATREIAEAWQREITRVVSRSGEVAGEARVEQNMGNVLGPQALRALVQRLTAGAEGWHHEAGGTYRFDVPDGYVRYRPDDRVLEIVARRTGTVSATGVGRMTVEGEVHDTLEAEGVGDYYEDGYGGRDEAWGRAQAEKAAEHKLQEAARERIETAKRDAERDAEGDVTARADADAAARLEQKKRDAQAALAEAARGEIEVVGARARRAFNQLLAQAYRDVILAYARAHGAEDVSCHEDSGSVEISFSVAS